MNIPSVTVDLGLPASRRWDFLRREAARCRDMMRAYVHDLGGVDEFGPILADYASAHVDADYLKEMEGIASTIETGLSEVLLANLYYDAMSFMLGCTAFAVDTPEGPMHARNLDWWSPGAALSEQTIICYYVHREALRFRTVSILRSAPVVSSSLLLVCGTNPGEMCVIERTPTRAEVRSPEDSETALQILQDEGVKMTITAQHMVLQPRKELLEVRLPG